ncbi:hypothetical protein J1G34_02305 [Pseudomonas sp. Wu6]|uniref:hypothetical protein n=1 Tax=Pseudomonas sp. Wu6 TaxID=1210129 RepID=UPI001CA747C3|nr:hypothetical protein [Pseudomonas sp. Wu6]MBY8927866.1 hypothetical protein [Pseudomonas sp. Wu6]
MSGLNDVTDFGEAWRGTENFKIMPVGNYVFRANIFYNSVAYGAQKADCTVLIVRNGMQDGDINIYEAGPLKVLTHHLGFKVGRQTYTYDATDDSLLIAGSSGKMGGSYSIKISPNRSAPSF